MQSGVSLYLVMSLLVKTSRVEVMDDFKSVVHQLCSEGASRKRSCHNNIPNR